MSCKPDLVTTRSMYAQYLEGKSCAQIAAIFGIARQGVWDRLRRQGFPLKPSSRSKALPFVEFEGARYAPGKDNYFRKTTGDRGLLHWAMWEKSNGPIKRGHEVRFIDGDRMNVEPDNLVSVRRGDGRSFGRSFPLKACIACGEMMGRRFSWNHREAPSSYANRQTCNAQCSAAWKRGRPRGSKMPKV